jgi:hypothetical protein
MSRLINVNNRNWFIIFGFDLNRNRKSLPYHCSFL